MKKSFTLFLLLISVKAFTQTHFITAGQTQGMVFTDYVPDKVLFPGTLGYFTNSIDLNHDGSLDVEFARSSSSTAGGGGHGGQVSNQTTIRTLNTDFEILCSYDTAIDDGYSCAPTYYYHTKNFRLYDTLNIYDSFFYNNLTFINKVNYYIGGGACYLGIWGSQDTSYFLAGRMITNSDTAFFYIHFEYPQYKVLDFAIEGLDSTIIISSANNLTVDNSPAISPNPFTNQINISTGKPFEYLITDYTGRVVLTGKVERNIATGELARGCYLLTIKNEETFSVKKIVKQ